MKRSAVIAITLALASAAVAAPNGLGQATNPNRAMRSGFAPRQRNNITNDIENARANAKRDFIRSQPDYPKLDLKDINRQAEEKFGLIFSITNEWSAGSDKGYISQQSRTCLVFDKDGKLLQAGPRNSIPFFQWIDEEKLRIEEEQDRIGEQIATNHIAEITAAEDAAEKAVRDRYAEQEAKRKAENEKQTAEHNAERKKKQANDKLTLDQYYDNFDAMMVSLFGVKFGMSTNELDIVHLDRHGQGRCKLPKKFRHFTEAEFETINGRIYRILLINPFNQDYSEESINSEFELVQSIFKDALRAEGGFINNQKKRIEGMLWPEARNFHPFIISDWIMRDKLTKEADSLKKAVPALQ